MANWAYRSSSYKLGLCLLFAGSLFYVIGYSAPFWQYSDVRLRYNKGGWVASGLWMTCLSTGRHSHCSAMQYRGWHKAVQAMQCLGLIGLIVSCIYAFVVNCCQTSQTYSRFLEIFVGLSGLCGFIGTMTYVGNSSEAMRKSYSWGFGLDLTGCILVIITSVMLFISNKPIMPPGPIYQRTAPPPQTTIVMHGQSYPPPAGSYPTASPPGAYPGAYPQAGVAPQGYPAQYPMGNVHPMGYSGGMAPNAGYSGNAPPPAYNTVAGYSGNMYYPQGYSAHYAPQQGYPTDVKTPQ